jgi:hypothetical protein
MDALRALWSGAGFVDIETREITMHCSFDDFETYWRSAVVVVQPATTVRWHRAGWTLFWRMKSRPGRPPIPQELRRLIRRVGAENPLWGEERIANELLLKLGVRISPRTVRKYLTKRPPGRTRGDQRWVDIPEEPREGSSRVRFLRDRHRDVSAAVRVCRHRARKSPSDARERHLAPKRSLDATASERSGWGHRPPQVSDP